MKKQVEESKKKIDEYKSALGLLTPLVGLTIKQMTSKQLEDYNTALGQILGLLDVTGKVKPA